MPSSSLRPGYSRRAHLSRFVGYVVAVVGLVLAGLLALLSALDPTGYGALKGVALDATAPVSATGRGGVRSVGDAVAYLRGYVRAGDKNARLERELRWARSREMEARAILYENSRLKALLGLRDRSADAVATTRIVGSSLAAQRSFATIFAGSRDGVRPNQPVRAPEGLIGRVLETGRLAARVMLITDGASAVPVRGLRDASPALAAGRGDGTVELRPLSAGQNPFRVGDVVLTSGTGGVFPPHVPVARVVRATRDLTIARPIADPGTVNYVLVQRAYSPPPLAPVVAAPSTAPTPAPAVAAPLPAPAPPADAAANVVANAAE